MKKQLFFGVVFIFVLFASNSLPQLGKPQYNIRCMREGAFLGDIKIELFRNVAPLHTRNFDSLVSIHFYDTTAFHRVVPNFVIQGGDPNSRHGDPSTWGNGDSSQTNVPAEFSKINHARGTLGAARDENINSANSQFFINVAENSSLNNRYTVYGAVYEGMNIADSIVNSPTVPGTERPIQKIEMFVTYLGVNNDIPNKPSLISPTNGKEGVLSSQNFTWSNVQGAVLYRLQISKDSTFSTIDYDFLLGSNSGAASNLPVGLVKFFWRVQANNGGNLSQFSEIFSFTTSIKPPILISPPDSSMGVSTSPLFEWNSVPGATSYKLLVASSLLFSTASTVINQTGILSTSFQGEGLSANKKYYWKVKGITPSYEGGFSSVRTFTTGNSVSVSDIFNPTDYSLKQNYPNPFNPTTTISYQLPIRSFVNLKLYDILGNEVATLVNQEQEAGTYNFSLSSQNYLMSSGVYIYAIVSRDTHNTFSTNGFTDSRIMVLIK